MVNRALNAVAAVVCFGVALYVYGYGRYGWAALLLGLAFVNALVAARRPRGK